MTRNYAGVDDDLHLIIISHVPPEQLQGAGGKIRSACKVNSKRRDRKDPRVSMSSDCTPFVVLDATVRRVWVTR